jgi:hypothetical protein
MIDSADLERGYRRLLAWYPRTFRREHEDEILGVLMANAGEGQRRPGLAESSNLIRNAIWMRLRPGAPRSARTVFYAVRLMYVGAALEVLTLITVLGTLGSLKSAIVQRDPNFSAAQWHAVLVAHIVPIAVGAPIAAGMWLWMAWANGRGHGWARVIFAGFFALTTLSLLSGIAQSAAIDAPADLIAGGVLWLVALAAVLLIFNTGSGMYYKHEPVPR